MSPFCSLCAHHKGDDKLPAQLCFLHVFPYAQVTGKPLQLVSGATAGPIFWSLTSHFSYAAAAGLFSLLHVCNCKLVLLLAFTSSKVFSANSRTRTSKMTAETFW